MADILKLPDVAEKSNQQGALSVGDTPEQFATDIKDDVGKRKAVVRSAKIKPVFWPGPWQAQCPP